MPSCKGPRTNTLWLPRGLAIGLAALPPTMATHDATAGSVETFAPRGDWLATLAAWPVTARQFARGELYTWTTAEQIAELRRDRVLFTREESPTFGPSHFDRVMIARAARGEAIPSMLRTPPFLRARFAWPNPWATLLGWDGESYGDRLIRVVLKPTAWIARGTARGTRWTVSDLAGQPIAPERLLSEPERLGAVHFVQDDRRAGGGVYREFVLPNESMVASWSVGTDTIRARVQRDISALRALRDEVRMRNAENGTRASVLARWRSSRTPRGVQETFEASLAFDNAKYLLEPSRIDAILGALGKIAYDDPIEHEPKMTFAELSVRRRVPRRPPPPSPPPPRRPGTFY